jgi:hypothetical protein
MTRRIFVPAAAGFILLLSACASQPDIYSAYKPDATASGKLQDIAACKVALAQSPLPYQPAGLIERMTQSRQNQFLADCMRSKGWTVVAEQ